MKVSIVLNRANKSWIIEKIASRLSEELISFGLNTNVSEEIDFKVRYCSSYELGICEQGCSPTFHNVHNSI